MPNIRVPGDAEGFGLVALEAVVCGTAVLAADLEGITEAIQHGKNGLLVDLRMRRRGLGDNKICGMLIYRKKLVRDSLVYTKKGFHGIIWSPAILIFFRKDVIYQIKSQFYIEKCSHGNLIF
jgi:hypothetical protein